MIAIIDYGMGNLRSAQKGFERAGFAAEITSDPEQIERADGVVLPGVGAFKDCYEGLCGAGMVEPVLAAAVSGKPLLGICVGMQLLFEYGEEGDGSPGLGLLEGEVERFPLGEKMHGLKVPHMGWNQVVPVPGAPCPLLEDVQSPYMYFVHSYIPRPRSKSLVLATTGYGIEFASVVGRDNIFGTQFHPEKSQGDGIKLLAAFGGLVEGRTWSSTY